MTRAHRSLLILTTVTVLDVGMTAQTLTEPAGAGADIQFAASAILLVISGTLLLRVMRHLSRTPHHNAGRVPAARQLSVRTPASKMLCSCPVPLRLPERHETYGDRGAPGIVIPEIA